MGETLHKKPFVRVHHLQKKFGDKKVLKNVSFSVTKGSIHGLIGLSGAGKTTLLRCLVGYYKPNRGKILIDQHDAKDLLSSRIGFTTQDNCFYEDLTLWENIRYFGSLYNVPKSKLKKRAQGLLKLVGLEDSLYVNAENLSGGMKRRFDLVLSLLHEPDILILDEPATGLDPMLRKKIWFIVKYINKLGVTTLISSHLLKDLEHVCTEISLLHKGTIITTGSPRKLRDLFSQHHEVRIQTEPGKYEKILRSLRKAKVEFSAPRRDEDAFVFLTQHPKRLIKAIYLILHRSPEKLVDLSIEKPSLESLLEQVAS